MTVRAKFKVDSVQQKLSGGVDIILYPVVGDTAENEAFYKYTPAGNIMLFTINEATAAQFKPGAEFYVDFTEAK